MRLILTLFCIFSLIQSKAQSIEKQLITICQSNDLKVIDKEIKGLKTLNDSLTDYRVQALINYEIIDDYRAYLYEIEYTKQQLNDKYQRSTILTYRTYRIKIISKNNQIASYEIEQGSTDNYDKWIVYQYIAENCETILYGELKKKYQSTFGIEISSKSIFDTSELYYMADKVYRCFDGCKYENKRKSFQQVIENQRTTILLNWLKSGNVALQLYAIEGIFILSEKGIEFPPNTWDFIQLVQSKKGQVVYAKNNFLESELVYTLVHQIKAKYPKGKRQIKRSN